MTQFMIQKATLPNGEIVYYQCDFVFDSKNILGQHGGIYDPIGQVAGWIVEQMRGVVQGVITGLGWFWDSILRPVADWVWNRLREAWDAIIRGIQSIVSNVWGAVSWIRDNLTKIADWVWDKLRGAWDAIIRTIQSIVSAIWDAVSWIRTNLAAVADWVWSKVRDAWDAIIRGIQTAVSTMYDWLKSAVSGLYSIGDWIKTNLGNVAEWVWNRLREAWDGLIKGIGSTANAIWAWVNDVGAKMWDMLQRIGATVMDSVGGVMAGLFDLAKGFIDWLGKSIMNIANTLIKLISDGLGWLIDKVKSALTWVYDQIISLAPKSVDEVPTKIPLLLGAIAAGGFGALLLADAASTRIAASGLNLGGIKKFLGEVFSPGLVQGALLGTIMTVGIGPWVGRWVRSTFRTWLPELKDIFILWRQKYFSDIERDRLYYQYGVPNGWEPIVNELMDYTPPIMELARVAQYTDIDLNWLKDKLIENGVTDRDIPYYLDMFLNTSLRRVHSEIYAELEKSLAYGVPSRDEFKKMMDAAKFRSFIQPYYLMAYDIVLARCRTSAWIDAWEEQLYRQLIEPEVFVERCLSIGVDKQIAIAKAMKQLARRGVYWEMPAA